ncbi:MAG: LD-carboxypeptidase [Alphaproteobacteria bacterium]|nr:LD-carboxypeptidase [Alphaproteobacteria bacterium]
MKSLIKPTALKKNDLVATVSLSWGGAGLLHERYEQGKKQFQDAFGVKIVEMTNTLKSPSELYENPEWRLNDLMEAFKNPDIKAILTNIGGNDTIRLLRHMNKEHFEIIKNNPKIFLGMSDTTANHFMCFHAGIASFYSPSLMYGYAENCGIPKFIIENTKKTLFETKPIGVLSASDEFMINRLDWATENNIPRPRFKNSGHRYIQGNKTAKGRLLGGCIESLDMINGTNIWPDIDEWNDVILFLETAEGMPSPEQVLFWLRNFGAQGILNRINGILFARPGGEFPIENKDASEKWIADYEKYDKVLLRACKEYECTDIPIVTNMDFGHTVPQLILPFGAMVEINTTEKTVSIIENAVV